jgi:hypothetical protein
MTAIILTVIVLISLGHQSLATSIARFFIFIYLTVFLISSCEKNEQNKIEQQKTERSWEDISCGKKYYQRLISQGPNLFINHPFNYEGVKIENIESKTIPFNIENSHWVSIDCEKDEWSRIESVPDNDDYGLSLISDQLHKNGRIWVMNRDFEKSWEDAYCPNKIFSFVSDLNPGEYLVVDHPYNNEGIKKETKNTKIIIQNKIPTYIDCEKDEWSRVTTILPEEEILDENDTEYKNHGTSILYYELERKERVWITKNE